MEKTENKKAQDFLDQMWYEMERQEGRRQGCVELLLHVMEAKWGKLTPAQKKIVKRMTIAQAKEAYKRLPHAPTWDDLWDKPVEIFRW